MAGAAERLADRDKLRGILEAEREKLAKRFTIEEASLAEGGGNQGADCGSIPGFVS